MILKIWGRICKKLNKPAKATTYAIISRYYAGAFTARKYPPMQKPDYTQYLADISALDDQKSARYRQYLAELAAYKASQPTAAEAQQDKQAATLTRLAWLKKEIAALDQERAGILANPSTQSALRLAALNSQRKSAQKRVDAIERKLERENPALINALADKAALKNEMAALLDELQKAQAVLSADELKHIGWYQDKKARYIELVDQFAELEP